MAEYAKKKNDELQALCKERGLVTTGKKADLVKRLEDHDAVQTTSGPAANAEDEIDWDDEPAVAAAKDGAGKAEAPVKTSEHAGVSAKDETVAPESDVPAGDVPTEAPTEEPKEPADFSSGLQELTFVEEMEKKVIRAEKWGTGNVEELRAELEQVKKRAERFGATSKTAPKALNSALSDQKERKRGREGDHDGGIRKKRGGKLGGGKDRGAPIGNNGSKKANGHPTWMTDKDRAAAEARKGKFGSG